MAREVADSLPLIEFDVELSENFAVMVIVGSSVLVPLSRRDLECVLLWDSETVRVDDLEAVVVIVTVRVRD